MTECEFPHNTIKMIFETPKKLVFNDPYKCHICNTQLYVTIQRAEGNDLLSKDIMWWLIISDKLQEVKENVQ